MIITEKNMRIKALQACIIPRHEISIQYKCKEYLTDIQRLICANKIMKYEIICRLYQGKINIFSEPSFLHVPKHTQNINKIPTVYFNESTFYIKQGK